MVDISTHTNAARLGRQSKVMHTLAACGKGGQHLRWGAGAMSPQEHMSLADIWQACHAHISCRRHLSASQAVPVQVWLSLPEQLSVLHAGLVLAGAILGPDRHTEGDSGEAAILLDVLESVLDSSPPQRQCPADLQASGSSEQGQAAWGASDQSLTQQDLAGGLTQQHMAGTEAVLATTLSSLMQALLALLEAGMGACKAACHMVAELLQERWLQLAAAGPHVIQSTLLVSTRALHLVSFLLLPGGHAGPNSPICYHGPCSPIQFGGTKSADGAERRPRLPSQQSNTARCASA